jgi:hypothetical protein
MALTRLGLNQSINLASNVTGTLATGNGGTGLASGFVNGGGLTVADQWRLTTSFTDSADPIASNFERVDSTGQGFIGSAMTESSGIFTFPSTGVYKIEYLIQCYLNGDTRFHKGQIQLTTNNSSYASVTSTRTFIANLSNNTFSSCIATTYFDVTDTSNCKVKFSISVEDSSTNTLGSSTENETSFTFTRLGDT